MERNNPIPVVVVLLPVIISNREGLVVIRRAIPPQFGKLALPGGYINNGESWQFSAAREVQEEANILIDQLEIEPFWFASTHSILLLFAVASTIEEKDLKPFTPNEEVLERGVIFGPSKMDLAFPLHEDAVNLYFKKRHNFREAGYVSL